MLLNITKCFFVILILSACSTTSIVSQSNYNSLSQQRLYDLKQWRFDGRIAVSKQNKSWQANISWQHNSENELIKLSAPLGQGRVDIELTPELITIRRGDKTESSTDKEMFIQKQLGLVIPFESLRYWIIGLPEKELKFVSTNDGFYQKHWLVEYKQMQTVDNNILPKKMNIINETIKLKLVIDEWVFNDKF